MIFKKIVYGLIIATLLLGAIFIFSSCSEDTPTAWVYWNEDILVPNVEYTLYFQDNDNTLKIPQNKVRFEIYDENTAGAVIVGNKIKASQAGSVTVKASYQKGDEYWEDWDRMVFDTLHLEIELERNGIVGERIPIVWSASHSGRSVSNVIPNDVRVVSGNAVIEKINGEYSIKADSVGNVTIRATFNFMGDESVFEQSFVFGSKNLTIAKEAGDYYVGSEVKLSSIFDGELVDRSRAVYTVKSGNATVENSILKANAPGEVVVYAIYEENGITYQSNDLKITFTYPEGAILSADGLLALANSSEEFYIGADIDLSAYENWTPIENFTGKLNGNGFTIKGLNISAKSMDKNKGLFAALKGTVENLKIEGTITCRGEAEKLGLLCGTNDGTIRNVTVSGTIDTPNSDYVGGIAGYSSNSYLTDCKSYATVTARDHVGGIAGHLKANRSADIVLSGNANHGNMIGSSYVGGVFGSLSVAGGQRDTTVTVISMSNYGEIIGAKNYIGGLFGHVEGNNDDNSYSYNFVVYVKITECENTANVVGTKYIGGIVGHGEQYVSEISYCVNSGDITGNQYVGGYAGRAVGTHMKSLVNNNVITGKCDLGGIAGSTGKVEDCTNNGTVVVAGFITTEDGQNISYAGGIAGYATGAVGCVNNSNIDASIGGDYVGGVVGYLKATRSSSEIVSDNTNHGQIVGTSYVGGVFGAIYVAGGQKDVTVTVITASNDGEIIGAGNNVGGVAGYVKGDYDDSSFSYHYIAYIKLSECLNEANVSGVDYVGGIIGRAEKYVTELVFSESEGEINGKQYVGGYVGRANDTTLKGLVNNSTVKGKCYVGGIAGYASKCVSCTNNGSIINQSYAIKDDTQAISYIGGIAGFATGAEGCVNNANIDASTGGDYVGGIIGYMNAKRSSSNVIQNNKNHGAITGTEYVGGIIGYFTVENASNTDTITISTNENDGEIVGSKDYVGGIAGYVKGTYYDQSYSYKYTSYAKVVECLNEANVTGADYVGGIVGGCGKYVKNEEVIWNTNSTSGNITAEGEHSGKLYGSVN